FVREGADWRLSAVNGATADNIPTGDERNIVPYRDGRDDTTEVPPWRLEVVGEPLSIPVTGVSVATSSVQLNVGQTQAVNASVAPTDASNGAVIWTSNDSSVATVTSTTLNTATIRAIGVGATTVT